MTDDPTHDTPGDDEPDRDTSAVHAVLDGEATAEERRRVAADPRLLDRLAEARAARDAVAAVPPPPDDDVLSAVRARALDEALGTVGAGPWTSETTAADHGGEDRPAASDDAEPTSGPAPVADLDGARRRRTPGRRLPPLPAVAAVVIVLVLVGVGLLLTDGDDGEETATNRPTEAAGEEPSDEDGAGQGAADADGGREEAPSAAEGGAADEAPAPGAEPSPDVAAVLEDLLALATATYPDPDELLLELRSVDPTTLSLPVPGSSKGRSLDGAGVGPDDVEVARCDVINANQEGLEPATAAVIVSVDGTPLVVTANHDPAVDATRLTVMELPACIPLGAVVR